MSDISSVEKLERKRVRHIHRHPPIVNVNRIASERLTRGQRVADTFASVIGSWTFIIIQSIVLMIWIAANI
ncbi:MAG: hypothetical protein ACREQF_10035, partial [Candidatus Binataceae bacterium]